MPRGPVPKRADQRRRRNASNVEQIKPLVRNNNDHIPGARNTWHPLMVEWYNSLIDSAQSIFYEQSDWYMAHIAAEIMSSELYSEKGVSASQLNNFLSISSNLLATEGDRRRMRVEIKKSADEIKKPEESLIDQYKELLGE